MESYQRSHVNTLVQRLAESPHHIIALFGPRQTGKTTIVRQALQQIESEHRYLAVDEPDPCVRRYSKLSRNTGIWLSMNPTLPAPPSPPL